METIPEEILSIYRSQINSTEDIKKCTCQFLVSDRKKIAKSLGTGVFIKVNDIPFIITAAHVIENYEGGLYIRNEQGVIQISFEATIHKTNSHKGKDKTDFAILKLLEKTTKDLNGFYDFIEVTELGINHKLKSNQIYLAYGYPSSRTKIKYKTNLMIAEPTYFMTTHADYKIYDELGGEIDKNLIIHYDKNDLANIETRQVEIGPDVYGMSGC